MLKEKSGDFLQWLRGFYFTVSEGSIDAAATKMGRGKPSITHQIKCLEQELGVSLFDRSSGGLDLTEEGKIVFDRAISVFEVLNEMEEAVQPSSRDLCGTIKIASISAVLLYFLPRFLIEFRKRYPMVTFELKRGGVETITHRVLNATSDFGIACLSKPPNKLNHRPLFDTNMVLISPKQSKWFTSSKPTLEEISKLPFISLSSGTSTEQMVSEQFSSQGLTPNIVLVINDYELMKRYVKMGLGISIIDEFSVTSNDELSLQINNLTNFRSRRVFSIIRRPSSYLSPAANKFIEFLSSRNL